MKPVTFQEFPFAGEDQRYQDPKFTFQTRPPAPTIGRIVRYRMSADDATMTNKRREDAMRNLLEHKTRSDGSQIHFGNPVHEGDPVAAVIVAVYNPGDSHSGVNLKCLLDGNDDYWATSVQLGEGPGTWSWPERS